MIMPSETKDTMSLFMQDFWKLEKEFWVPENTNEYWNKLVETTGELHKKYQQLMTPQAHKYAETLLLAFVSAKEEEAV